MGEIRRLDETAFAQFAQLTGDAHPIHYDAAYAKTTRFGACVAHGLLLASMTALGATRLSEQLHDAMIALLGQGLAYLRPVLAGESVRAVFEVESAVPGGSGRSGKLRFRVRLENGRGEAVAEGHHEYLLHCRPRE